MWAASPAWAQQVQVSFAPAQSYGEGDFPQSVTHADFDSDGDADLAVANRFSASVSVLLGEGDGTFGAAQSYGAGDRPISGTAADFDSDDDPDLGTANANSNNVSILLNTTGENQPPEANDKSAQTNQGQPETITLSASDPDGDDLSFQITDPPENGSLGDIGPVSCEGTRPRTCEAEVTYTPDPAFSGTDTFGYSASDGAAESEEATVTITVDPVTDLAIDKQSPEKIKKGKKFSYALTVTNAGPSDAAGVTITDTLPEGVEFVSEGTDSRCSHDPVTRTVSCSLGTLASSDTEEVVIRVRAKKTHEQSNTATVDAATTDPNNANDSDTASTRVKKNTGNGNGNNGGGNGNGNGR